MSSLMRAVTHLGGTLPCTAIVVLALVLARLRSHSARPVIARDALLLLAPLLAGACADVLKEAVERPRPPGPALADAAGWGFPSSHAARSAATAVVVIAVVAAYQKSVLARRALVAAAVLFALVVGWSRVYLHVHYFSDVAAGWLVGIAAAGVVLSARRWALRQRGRLATTEQSEATDGSLER